MGARYYEQNTSGLNFDRFLDRFDETTLVTMKRHYWTAKQLLRSKLGKKEDEHLLASDAELDSKLTLFRSVRDTSENLLACIEQYQAYLLDATLVENELGKYLKVQGKQEKREETSTIMVAVGRCLLFSSHQMAAVRNPIVRFYQELHVFAERAIADCAQTVDAAERARIAYRGSLMWMKKMSEELDPDTDRQLEKFREAQTAVRTNKDRLDKLKLDTLQKVDLLSASRSNLLSHLLGKYLEMLISYYQKTARAYSALSANLSTFQHYEFEILTDLIEPSKKVAKQVRQESIEKERLEKERRASNRSEKEEDSTTQNLLNFDEETDENLKNYLFGRQSPLLPDTSSGQDEDRVDSPLGILEEGEEALDMDDVFKKVKIGPLIGNILDADESGEVPKLLPPPSYQPLSQDCQQQQQQQPSTSTDDFTSMPLFAVEHQRSPVKPAPPATSIMDLLNFSQPAENSQFPNPFDGSNNEWDLLLSQCDAQQQSNDLI